MAFLALEQHPCESFQSAEARHGGKAIHLRRSYTEGKQGALPAQYLPQVEKALKIHLNMK